MATVVATLARLHTDRESGALAAVCAAHQVDLLVIFGSAVRNPAKARDIDLAYSFTFGVVGDDLAFVNAMGEAYGDALDLMPLDRAGSVARYAALGPGKVLVELTAQKFANQQIAAFGSYVDTQPLRDEILERLAR